MREIALQYLACPTCSCNLLLHSIAEGTGGIIETAQLRCVGCLREYPVVRCIPRFVANENYAASFGFQWTRYAQTQYDSYSGITLSERRFFEETGWPRDLCGQVILEAGSGAGRLTEQAASTGAMVISFDYSAAVETNYHFNGAQDNVLIVQADIYSMPFRACSFDKIFCIGVLQHTPDVHKAFLAFPPLLKVGGELVVDVYKKSFFRKYLATEYYLRHLTKTMEPERLYKLTRHWIDLIWRLSRLISKIPRVGPALNWRLLVPDYSIYGLSGPILQEWAYLDAFDMLAPRYDSPQTIRTITEWFQEAHLTDISIRYGYNGIEGRGKRP